MPTDNTVYPNFIAKVLVDEKTNKYEPLIPLSDEPDINLDKDKGVAVTPKALYDATEDLRVTVQKDLKPNLANKLDKTISEIQTVQGPVIFDKLIQGTTERANQLSSGQELILQMGNIKEKVVQVFDGSKSCTFNVQNIDASIVNQNSLPPAVLPIVTTENRGAVPTGDNNTTSFLNGQCKWSTITPESINALRTNTTLDFDISPEIHGGRITLNNIGMNQDNIYNISLQIQNDAITTDKIKNQNVTTAKIADANITSNKLSTDIGTVYRAPAKDNQGTPPDDMPACAQIWLEEIPQK